VPVDVRPSSTEYSGAFWRTYKKYYILKKNVDSRCSDKPISFIIKALLLLQIFKLNKSTFFYRTPIYNKNITQLSMNYR